MVTVSLMQLVGQLMRLVGLSLRVAVPTADWVALLTQRVGSSARGASYFPAATQLQAVAATPVSCLK